MDAVRGTGGEGEEGLVSSGGDGMGLTSVEGGKLSFACTVGLCGVVRCLRWLWLLRLLLDLCECVECMD